MDGETLARKRHEISKNIRIRMNPNRLKTNHWHDLEHKSESNYLNQMKDNIKGKKLLL